MKKLLLFTILHSFLLANSCPRWAPIAMDDIVTIISIYNGNNTQPDKDCDGLSDTYEISYGTDPNRRDTDGDGTDDYNDDYPLNPNKSKDTTAPVLTLKGSNPMVIYRYIPFRDPGALAIDDRDGAVTVQTRGTVNTHVPNTYSILYSARDKKGNISTKRRTVVVKAEIKPQIILDSSTPTDDAGDRPSNIVDAFIKAYISNNKDKVSELVGESEALMALLYTNPDATTFLKRIYSHTYMIEGKKQATGDASVTISFIDDGGHHKGGFELVLGTDVMGVKSWLIKQIY